jgi:hypothetical protein
MTIQNRLRCGKAACAGAIGRPQLVRIPGGFLWKDPAPQVKRASRRTGMPLKSDGTIHYEFALAYAFVVRPPAGAR